MYIKRYCITLTLLLFCACITHSQERHTGIRINFRVNSSVIDTGYSNNAASTQKLMEFLRNIREDSTINIIKITICGSASPEGSYQLNRKLAQGRLSALEKLILNEVDIPDSLITHNDSYIPWEYLKSQIENSSLSHKDEAIAILEEEGQLVKYHHPYTHIDNRILKLMALDNGKIWQQMNKLLFEQMRNACAVFVTWKKMLPPIQKPIITPKIAVTELAPAAEVVEVTETVIPETAGWNRKLHLKTNAIGLGMAIANVAVEVDLAEHWSITLPIYYSAWDYFKSTIKFRTLAVQPELRHWLSGKNDGFFAGAHFGVAYYNFAFDGEYRYQDHKSKTPAIGGGVGIGYRLPISRDNRWGVEFSLGAGVHSLHYDKFHNTPRTKDGLMTGSVRRTYWGIDQAAVSFCLSFDLKKKGGRQ